MTAKKQLQQTGVSRYDFTISLGIITIIACILLFSLDRAQNQAEQVAVETDLSNMRWGLRELWVHLNATGQSLSSNNLANANPVKLLNEPLKNYGGEFAQTPPDTHSIWYFDNITKQLVYVFSDGRQVRYRLVSITKLDRASLGAIGGMDLVLER